MENKDILFEYPYIEEEEYDFEVVFITYEKCFICNFLHKCM